MSNEIKVGDLVILIRSVRGNEGKIGEVTAMLGEFPWYGGWRWYSRSGPCALVRWTSPAKPLFGGALQEAPAPLAWLRKIPPLDELEGEKRREELTA